MICDGQRKCVQNRKIWSASSKFVSYLANEMAFMEGPERDALIWHLVKCVAAGNVLYTVHVYRVNLAVVP